VPTGSQPRGEAASLLAITRALAAVGFEWECGEMSDAKTVYTLQYDGKTFHLPTSEGEEFLQKVELARHGFVTVQLNEDVYRTFNLAGVPWSFESRPYQEIKPPPGPMAV
jgi:hypothetical protein